MDGSVKAIKFQEDAKMKLRNILEPMTCYVMDARTVLTFYVTNAF